jgi:hypothetical protein
MRVIESFSSKDSIRDPRLLQWSLNGETRPSNFPMLVSRAPPSTKDEFLRRRYDPQAGVIVAMYPVRMCQDCRNTFLRKT